MAQRTQTVIASWEKTAQTVIKKLERHNIEGHWAPTSADAVALVRSWMADGDSVTWAAARPLRSRV